MARSKNKNFLFIFSTFKNIAGSRLMFWSNLFSFRGKTFLRCLNYSVNIQLNIINNIILMIINRSYSNFVHKYYKVVNNVISYNVDNHLLFKEIMNNSIILLNKTVDISTQITSISSVCRWNLYPKRFLVFTQLICFFLSKA